MKSSTCADWAGFADKKPGNSSDFALFQRKQNKICPRFLRGLLQFAHVGNLCGTKGGRQDVFPGIRWSFLKAVTVPKILRYGRTPND